MAKHKKTKTIVVDNSKTRTILIPTKPIINKPGGKPHPLRGFNVLVKTGGFGIKVISPLHQLPPKDPLEGLDVYEGLPPKDPKKESRKPIRRGKK